MWTIWGTDLADRPGRQPTADSSLAAGAAGKDGRPHLAHDQLRHRPGGTPEQATVVLLQAFELCPEFGLPFRLCILLHRTRPRQGRAARIAAPCRTSLRTGPAHRPTGSGYRSVSKNLTALPPIADLGVVRDCIQL